MLKGLGVTMGLPYLDAMTPAFASVTPDAVRLAVMYAPNGMYMPAWRAGDDGTLQPLARFPNRCTRLNDVTLESDSTVAETGPHSFAATGFLTGCSPRRSESELQAGVSIDQQAARISAIHTRIPSIELACESPLLWMDREAGYLPAYLNHLSWRSPSMPMPAETNPKEAFARLFSEGAMWWSRKLYGPRMSDRIRPAAASLATALGAPDRSRLNDFLDSFMTLKRARVLPTSFRSVTWLD